MSGRKIFVGHGFSTLRNVKYDSYFRDLAESLRRVDKIVALSTLLEEVPFCAEHGLPEPQVIPNGVDLAEWRAATRGLRERWGIGKRFWVLLVSNHSTVKGHPAFFEVVRRVRKHFPDVAGTIIGGHYPAAKWGIGRLGVKGGCWYCCRVRARLDPGVSLRWGVPREDVVSAVQEADIMVITSWREASPLVVLESMAAGTPWVSFDVGCAKEHVGGIIVGSVREMASKVIDLLSDADLRRRLGDEGPRRVHVRHAWERIADQYEALYQHVVEEPAGVPKQCPPWRC
jgi:glycosyltransferase involved in cell wall biosynthesis